jgi:nicotinate-nucleotide adenylyltransferase
MTDGKLRMRLVKAAIRGQQGFVADARELRRAGPSYTIDTIEALGLPPAALFLMIGSETFLDLLSWREPRRIAERCRIVVVPRAGSAFAPDGAAARKVVRGIGADGIARAEDGVPERGVIVVHATSLPLSASDIRARAAAGASLAYRVPPAVAAYIADRRLYRGPA